MERLLNKSRQRGLATVEAALVVPFVLVLVLGVMEYGWMFLKVHHVANAARRGARVAILPYSSSNDVLSSIEELMEKAGLSDTGYNVDLTPPDVSSALPNDAVTVRVTVPYVNVGIISIPLLPVPENLRAAVSMAKEGP